VTICTHGHKCLFGEIVNSATQLNRLGNVVSKCWLEIPHHFPNVEIDTFVVMSNHFHGILIITDKCKTTKYYTNTVHNVRRGDPMGRPYIRPHGPTPDSIGTIIGQFKSVVTKRINKLRGTPGARLWQRNYYEHVIRNEMDLNDIRQYILDNPVKWDMDENNPDRLINEPKPQGEPVCLTK
jgi:putative transposase